jgi:hypothetical protein
MQSVEFRIAGSSGKDSLNSQISCTIEFKYKRPLIVLASHEKAAPD